MSDVVGQSVSEVNREKIDRLIHSESFKRSMVKVLKSLAALARAQQARVVLLKNNEENKYVILSTANKPPGEAERFLIKSVCQTQLFVNIAKDSLLSDEQGQAIDTAKEPSVTVPLVIDGTCYGVLQLQGKLGAEDFNEHDCHLVQSSTSLFSRFLLEIKWDHAPTSSYQEIIYSVHRLLFENLYLYKDNLESNQLFSEIIRVSKLVNTTLDLQSLLESIMSSAKLVLRTESSSLMLLDEKTGELYFTIVTGGNDKEESNMLKQIRIPKGQGIAGFVAENRESLIVNDPPSDPRWFKGADEKTNFVTRNILAVPLIVRNRIIGVLEVINAVGRDNFNEKDLELVNSFSELAALAIYNRDLIDSLTRTNEELARKVDDLSSLHEVSKTLISTLDEKELFSKVVHIIAEVSSVDRVFIALYRPEHDDLEVVSSYGIKNENVHILLPLQGSLTGECFQQNKTISSNSLTEADYENYSDNGMLLKNNCVLYPLAHKEGVYGVVGISECQEGKEFNDDDVQLLSTIGGQIIKGIQNFRLLEEMIQKREYDKELEITSSIQKEILPASKLESDYVDMAVLSIPARLMGGDFYDYYALSDKEFTFTIADVSGKSLPASLFMAVTSSILRTVGREHPAPADVIRRSNELIFQDSRSGMFVTVFYCLYNAQTRTVRFASAGHNELYLYRNKSKTVELYKTKGIPLGILSSQEYEKFSEDEFAIEPNDVILLFTDGVTEAINEQKEEFGEERLQELFKKIHDLPAEEIIHKIYEAVKTFSGDEPQFDDVTLIVVKALETSDSSPVIRHHEKKFTIDSSELDNVKKFLENVLAEWTISEVIIQDIVLCCDEAVTNIVTHGYKNLSEEKKKADHFICELEMSGKTISIRIIDQGAEFDYTKVPEPDINKNLEGKRTGGFGVFLMRSLMDDVKFYRQGEQNFLTMSKTIG